MPGVGRCFAPRSGWLSLETLPRKPFPTPTSKVSSAPSSALSLTEETFEIFLKLRQRPLKPRRK